MWSQIFRRHSVSERELSAYLDGALPGTQRSRVEEHVAHCASCGRMVEELRAVKAAVSELPRVRAPRSFALSPAAERPAPVPRFLTLLRTVGAMATVLLLAAISYDIATLPGNDEAPAGLRQDKAMRDLTSASSPAAPDSRPEAAGARGAAPPSSGSPAAPAPTVPDEPTSPEQARHGGGDRTLLRLGEAALALVAIGVLGSLLYQRSGIVKRRR